MAGRISIRVTKNIIPAIVRALPEAGGVIVKRNLDAAAERARALVPVDTGALQNTIDVEMTSQTEGRLVAGGGAVDYAQWVEFGTARQAARPFLAQAVADQKAQFEDDFRNLEGLLR